MKKWIRRIIGVVSVGFAVLLIWFLYLKGPSFKNVYNSFGDDIPEEYPVMGIDISHYQGEVNWDQLGDMRIDDDSIQFVFIKATEGLSVRDDRKRINAFGARSQEIDYGFYHFFIPTLSASDQADFFCESIGGYNFDLKPVLDIETETTYSKKRLLDSVNVFLNRVEEQLEVRPIIYTYSNFYDNYFSNHSQELFWVAKYSRRCDAMENKNVICWQFSETGTVDGINEKVDLNIAKDNFFEVFSRY
ncbi:hypothetical protein K6119_03955 [Paracrocinitomix mangrovi]|uniref:glycoside hydrolase family 25 protein n=1 Tax=Paracrocinitomix mangrovi TaxID=2862509 RepID=UPI001C8D79AF|nr:GH25 family lysozyme [Paracrocinitomix mangrovi]UKN02666.1 hypothetical protein K6119_03955 [Paracrocinitomix mangrovi]